MNYNVKQVEKFNRFLFNWKVSSMYPYLLCNIVCPVFFSIFIVNLDFHVNLGFFNKLFNLLMLESVNPICSMNSNNILLALKYFNRWCDESFYRLYFSVISFLFLNPRFRDRNHLLCVVRHILEAVMNTDNNTDAVFYSHTKNITVWYNLKHI